MKEAMFYQKEDGGTVRCLLCPHRCLIREDKTGICAVRKNTGGTLYSLVYGKAIAEHADPIEKKPLFHVLPGSRSYSISTVGCNLTCRHCQNADISQMPRDRGVIMGNDRSPDEVVASALKSGCQSLSFTYTEPTIYFEYAYDIAGLAAEKGLINTFVSNGYTSPEALELISDRLSAANIDLKSFSDDFYKQICGASLEPVLDAIRTYRRLGIWIEITTLLIPGLNDSDRELTRLAEFIADMGVEIPWHVTAFYPTYRLTDNIRTPSKTLARARRIGQDAGLRYVYTGNNPGDEGECTYCFTCGKMLLKRYGFQILDNSMQQNGCPDCKTAFDGVV